MFFYRYVSARGRAVLADLLDADDPFALKPLEIVERVLALGYTPNLMHVRSEPLNSPGLRFVIGLGGQDFIVHVSRDAEEIAVEEVREDAYDEVK